MTTIQARAAARLCTGSAIASKGLARWFVPEERPVATTIRLGTAGWLGLNIGPAMLDHGALLATAGVCWCWAAWRAAAPADVEPEDKQGDDDGPRYTDAEIREAVLRLLHAAVAGRNGVHVAELLGELQRVGYLGDEITVAELRRALDRWAVPTRSSLKVDGIVRPGVHRDDLPPLPEPVLATTR